MPQKVIFETQRNLGAAIEGLRGQLSVIVFLFSALVFVLVRWILNASVLLNIDEAHFAACAARVIDAQDFALIGCRDNKPPGIFWLYEIGIRLFGIYNISAVRWLQTAGLVIAAYFLYLTAQQSKLKSAGAWTASLFLLAMSVDQAMVAAKTEALAVLPMAVGAFAITKSVLSGKPWLCFVFGACAAAASLCKQPAGIVLVAGAIVVLVCTRDRRAKMLASIAAGFAVTYLLVIAVYTAKQGLSDFFLQVIELPSKYASVDRISLSRRLFRVLTYTEEYGRLTPVLSACGIGGLVFVLREVLRGRTTNSESGPVFLTAALFAALGLLAAFAGADLYLNYYIMALPGFALCAGLFIALLLANFPMSQSDSPLLLSIKLMLLLGLASNGILSLKEPLKSVLDKQAPTEDSLASTVQQLAGSDGKIYVWGYSPDVYVRANRIPASRYVLTDVLVGFFGEGSRQVDAKSRLQLSEPGGWDKFLSDITKTPPQVFVDASENDLFGSGSFSIDEYPALQDWIRRNYVLHSEFNQGIKSNVFRVYVRKLES